MSKAERQAKQTERMTEEARAYAEQRQKLAPKDMAVHVARCFHATAVRWNEIHAAHWVIAAYRRAHLPKYVSGTVNQMEQHA